MWSAIAAVIAAISSGIRLAAEWLAKKRDDLLISLGATKQSNADLSGRIDAMEKGNELREASHGQSERDPSSILSDDGFQRKDDD